MRLSFAAMVVLACFLSPAAFAQNQPVSTPTSTKDPQAVAVLNQSLNALGGSAAVGAIQDCTASGTITYYWTSEAVQGSVTLRGLGPDAVRLDAVLPSGTRSLAVNHGMASLQEIGQQPAPVTFDVAVNFNSWAFPHFLVAAALNDPSISVSLVGTTTVGGNNAYDVHVQRIFTPQADPDGSLSQLADDLIIDATSYLIVETRDTIQPPPVGNASILHQVQFSNYQSSNGVLLPNSVNELVGGQPTAAR